MNCLGENDRVCHEVMGKTTIPRAIHQFFVYISACAVEYSKIKKFDWGWWHSNQRPLLFELRNVWASKLSDRLRKNPFLSAFCVLVAVGEGTRVVRWVNFEIQDSDEGPDLVGEREVEAVLWGKSSASLLSERRGIRIEEDPGPVECLWGILCWSAKRERRLGSHSLYYWQYYTISEIRKFSSNIL